MRNSSNLITAILPIGFSTIADTGIWTSLSSKGAPLNVQEHSMVYWDDCVYVFGGIFAAADECPLWTYQISVIALCLTATIGL